MHIHHIFFKTKVLEKSVFYVIIIIIIIIIIKLQMGRHPVAVAQHTFTHLQYAEYRERYTRNN
jgi:hypothetical protein